MGGGGIKCVPKEINSFVWKAMKENQECTSGDYLLLLEANYVKLFFSTTGI